MGAFYTAKQQHEINDLRSSSAYMRADNDQKKAMEDEILRDYADKKKKAYRLEQAAQIASIGMNTASAIMKAWEASPLTFGLPWSAVIGAFGASQAALVASTPPPAFAKGGDFITSGPQMIMVGDNPGGRERVQVTPMSSPNINGPQGGITIQVNGNLVASEAEADRFAEIIAKRSKQGFNRIAIA